MHDNPVALLPRDEQYAFLLRTLALCNGFDGICSSDLFWRTDAEYAPFTIMVNCNDLFHWATADCEEITPGNIELLASTISDCRPIEGGAVYAADLFAARARKMRPMRKAYPDRAKYPKICELFNACGPERDPKSEG